MAGTTNTKGAIAKAGAGTLANKDRKDYTLKDWIASYEGEIAKALPSVITPERFSRMAMTALTKTPKLAECTPASFVGALLTAAQLGLEPNTPLGQAYLIPFRNGRTGKTECQFQIGYKGMIDLANRSGEIQVIDAHIVYENDDFECEFGLEPKLRHKPTLGDRGKSQLVYAMYKTINGGFSFEVMSVEECMAHGRKYSKSFNNSPWQTAPEEMMKKTVLKKVLKYAPVRSDFIRGAEADEQVSVFNSEESEINVIPIDDEQDVVIDADTGEVKDV